MFLATLVFLVGIAMVFFYLTEAASRYTGRELHPLDLLKLLMTSARYGWRPTWRAVKRPKPAGWHGGC